MSKAPFELEKDTLLTLCHEREWPDPKPLPQELPPVMSLDPAMLPEPLRPWLVDIAERLSVPLDFPATTAVVALGSLIGRRVGLAPKRHDHWLVVANLWGAIVARPSKLKSPAMEAGLTPLNRLVVEAIKAYQQDLRLHELEEEIAEAQKEARRAAMKKAARAENAQAQLARLREHAIETPEKPRERRYVVNDPTTEKISELLICNPNGLLLVRDELRGWLKSLDKAGREGDRQFWLEAWNGTGRFTVDRIGRGTLHVPALCMSVFGCLQPGPLSSYVYRASQDGAEDDGLLQRFQVLAWPDHHKWELVDRRPNNEAKNRAYLVFKALAEFDPHQVGASPQEPEGIPVLRFSPEAQEAFYAWWTNLEARLAAGVGSPAMESHLAKYRRLFGALALQFHLIDVVSGQATGPVSEEAALTAELWCDYLESHARRVYASAEAPELEGARSLLAKLRRGVFKGEVTPREIALKGWAKLGSVGEVSKALEVLELYGWMKLYTSPTAQHGGRPSVRVRLHPRLEGVRQ